MFASGTRRSRLFGIAGQLWRFVVVGGLTLPLVAGATSNVAFATTTRQYSSMSSATKTTTLPAGSYSGGVNGQNNGVAFYVSNSQMAVQNITVGGLTLKCARGTTVGLGDISVDSVPLKSGGSFNTTTTEQGVYNGSPATYKINFKGKLQGLKNGEPVVIGSIAETLGLANAGSCSSGPALPWTVTRDATQTVTTGLPPAGSYSGGVLEQNNGVAFYVSNNQASLQNLTVGGLTLKCAPGSTVGLGDISVDSVPLNSDGSFNTTTTEQGVYNGSPATYKITFQGYFHGLNSSGVARAAGSVTETMTYTHGTSYSCSSGPESPWTVTRDATQTVTTALPPAGSFSGGVLEQNNGVAFYVSNTKTALQNLTVGGLTLNCAPGTTVKLGDISVDSVPLNSDGSFNTTTTEQGVYNGSPATYKITFQGYFHGLNSSGVARAAGSVTETMTYTHGTSYSCSSGPEFPWTVTRDATQTVTTGLPPVGSYSGGVLEQNNGVAFYVSNTKTALQNLTVGRPYPQLCSRKHGGPRRHQCRLRAAQQRRFIQHDHHRAGGVQRKPGHVQDHIPGLLPRLELIRCRSGGRLGHRDHDLHPRDLLQLYLGARVPLDGDQGRGPDGDNRTPAGWQLLGRRAQTEQRSCLPRLQHQDGAPEHHGGRPYPQLCSLGYGGAQQHQCRLCAAQQRRFIQHDDHRAGGVQRKPGHIQDHIPGLLPRLELIRCRSGGRLGHRDHDLHPRDLLQLFLGARAPLDGGLLVRAIGSLRRNDGVVHGGE